MLVRAFKKAQTSLRKNIKPQRERTGPMSISSISASNPPDIKQDIKSVQQSQQESAQLQPQTPQTVSSDSIPLQSLPQSQAVSSSLNQIPLPQVFGQLEQALSSGNLAAAQKDLIVIENDLQALAAQQGQSVQAGQAAHSASGSSASQTSQLLSQLGKDLRSGNLNSAAQTFTALQQDLQQSGLLPGQNSGQNQHSTSPIGNKISVNA